MIQYAHYIDEFTISYPDPDEFRGIPNWQMNDQSLRHRHYVPMIGEPEPALGMLAEPSRFMYVKQSETRTVPVEVEVYDYFEDPETHEKIRTGSHHEWQDRDREFDTSYIQVIDWTYTPIPDPDPVPLPTRFTKGALLEALKANDLYDQAKAVYIEDIDLQIAFAGFADIDLQYRVTQAIMQQYPELFSQANVQLLLEWIRDHQ